MKCAWLCCCNTAERLLSLIDSRLKTVNTNIPQHVNGVLSTTQLHRKMFSLAAFISWISGAADRTVPEEQGNDRTQMTIENQETMDECWDYESSIKSDVWNPVVMSNRCDSTELPSDDIYECLRTSDSEDWDEEISAMQANNSTSLFLNNPASCSMVKMENPSAHCGKDWPQSQTTEKLSGTDWSGMFPNNDVLAGKLDVSQVIAPIYENDYCEEGHSFSHNTSATEHEPKDVFTTQEITKQFESKSFGINCETDLPENRRDELPLKTKSVVSYDFENLFDWDYMEKLNDLETVFLSPDKSKFIPALKKVLESVSSPYSFLLYLIENYYSSVTEGKNSMAHVALTQFVKWNKEKQFSLTGPAEMEKDRALWIVTTKKLYLFDLCNEVFKLDSKGNEYLQKHVYYLLETKKRFKEAITIANKLHLQPCFQPMEILLPLVILNKVQLVESYVADCRWQQRAFVAMLDKLCIMTDEDLELLSSKMVPGRNGKITQASLTKLGERMVKKFQLDPDDFPELFKAKNFKGLSYLLHQRQTDKGRSTKKWDDLIERCVGTNPCLQQSLVELLTEFGDKDEAQRWARFYQLPCEQRTDVPKEPVSFEMEKKEDWENEIKENKAVSSMLGSYEQKLCSDHGYYEGQGEKYLSLRIPMENIYFVDGYKSLRYCRRELSKPGVTVGFDAEWKPQMCQAGSAQRLSIVQLSLRDKVFILDAIGLAERIDDSSLLAFGNAVFANEKVMKLGYGVESDFKALIATLPVMEKVIKKMKRFVDLCTLSQELFEIPAIKAKVETITKSLTTFGHLSEKGLSLLVQQCLGLPLDKTYQLSDWEQRPLLEKQVVYAALDARCLIDVFDVLSKWMIEEKIEKDLNECSPRLPWLFPKRSRKTKAKLGKQPKPGSSNFDVQRLNEPAVKGAPNSPRNFRVVVDNMLQGLGRYLRCCGVDVVMLANEDDHDKAAKLARREERVVLTTGTPYYTLRSQVPLGRCMCVPAGNAKEQVLAVFKHFNISVNTSDIFSRCQVCNGNEYVRVSSMLMRQAYISYYESECEKLEMRPQTRSSTVTEDPSLPLNVNTLYLRSGIKLRIEALPESVLDKVELFFCCVTCGKIYWEGGHFTRVCTQFSEVLNRTQSFYQKNRTVDVESSGHLL